MMMTTPNLHARDSNLHKYHKHGDFLSTNMKRFEVMFSWENYCELNADHCRQIKYEQADFGRKCQIDAFIACQMTWSRTQW
jgi:hypothetical protein